MKIVKISSLGCVSCIIMNKVFNKLKDLYSFDYEEYDFDFDDIEKYNVGKILPVFIFYDDEKEITRLCGEKKLDDFVNIIEGVNDEKNN